MPTSGLAVRPRIQSTARWLAMASVEAILTVPSSWMSILVPVRSVISRIVLPPPPITAPILSVGIWIVVTRGTVSRISGRGMPSALAISPRMCLRPSRACVQGDLHDLGRDAGDLDVHLQRGDAVLGAGDLEVHVAQMVLVAQDVGEDGEAVALLDQAHGDAGDRRGSGTPASISASDVPQTVAIEEEPLLSVISETTRIV